MPCWCTTSYLSRSALENTCARPDGDHDGRAGRWYLFTLIDHSPQLLPTRHVAALELSCARRRELEPWGHVAIPELSCARRREPGPRGTWRSRSWCGSLWQELKPWGTLRSRSCPVLGNGSRGHRAHTRARSCRGPWWQELEPRGTWRLQSYPVPGYESRGTCGHVRPFCLSSLFKACTQGIRSLR
jgi:hypothetical protein